MFIKALSISLLFILNINANVVLDKSYCIYEKVVTKSIFTKNKKDKEVLVYLPQKFKTFNVTTIKIAKNFDKVIDKTKGIIKFTNCNKILKKTKSKIVYDKFYQYLKNKYPELKINKLKIEPLSKKYISNVQYITTNHISKYGHFIAISNKGTKVKFRYKLMAKVKAYILKKDTKKGTNISNENLNIKYIDFTNSKYIIYKDNILGKITRINIKANKTIKVHMLRKELLIQRGNTVTAIYNDGILEIKILVTVLKNASKHDIVNVKTTQNKILKAKVLDSLRVMII